LDAAGEPLLVLGGGSNLLVADAGFPGTVVRVRTRGVAVSVCDDATVRVRVQAGEPWDQLVARAVSEGWSGIEALSGIPGSTGATPIQNVGAYGAEVASVIESIDVLDRSTGRVGSMATGRAGFGYRTSALKRTQGRWLVLAVTFRLPVGPLSAPVRYAELAGRLGVAVGDRVPLAEVRVAVLDLRRSKGMVLDYADHDTWSAGSFFTNPILSSELADTLPPGAPRFPQPDGTVKTSAAWLISNAGFERGFAVRPGAPAALSTKHSLALTNRGGATAEDLLELAREVRAGVRARFGITLENEPVLVGCSL
jgi:UDP-N-acetylmuramate dehydrogenase